MNTKAENLNPVQLLKENEADPTSVAETAAVRKPFVEPEVTFPVDVLEATTFFQLTDSGAVI